MSEKNIFVILATSVYWANVSVSVKNLFNRLLGGAIEETDIFPKLRLRGKRRMILISYNMLAHFLWILEQSSQAVRNIDEFFRIAGVKAIGKVVCVNAKSKKELSKQTVKKIERYLKSTPHPLKEVGL